MRVSKLTAALASLTIAFSVAQAPAAGAVEPPHEAAASLVSAAQKAAEDQGLVLEPAHQGGGPDSARTSTSELKETSVSDQGLSATLPEGRVTISPPQKGEFKEIDNLLVDGNSAYASNRNGVAGYRILEEGQSLAIWNLSVPDPLNAVLSEDGSVRFVSNVEGLTLERDLRIETPWAIDESGKSLDTHFELVDGQLRQVVDTSGAQGVVVADPRLTFGWGTYLNAWGHEWNAATAALAGVGGAAGVVGCAVVGNLPTPLRFFATAVCGVAGWNLINVLQIMGASAVNLDGGACYQMQILPSAQGVVPVPPEGNCIA